MTPMRSPAPRMIPRQISMAALTKISLNKILRILRKTLNTRVGLLLLLKSPQPSSQSWLLLAPANFPNPRSSQAAAMVILSNMIETFIPLSYILLQSETLAKPFITLHRAKILQLSVILLSSSPLANTNLPRLHFTIRTLFSPPRRSTIMSRYRCTKWA